MPQVRPLSDNPDLKKDYEAWRSGRRDFLTDLQREDSTARDEGWQRSYFRGAGDNAPNTRLRLKDFEGKS